MNTKRALASASILALAVALFSGYASSQPWHFNAHPGNPVLGKGAAGHWDAGAAFAPSVVIHNDTTYIFYTGTVNAESQPLAIGLAVSVDGFAFTKSAANPILQADGSGFDAYAVSGATVLVEESAWIMYYGAKSSGGSGPGDFIGRATATRPEGPWIRLHTAVLSVGSSGEWDAGFIAPSSVLRTDSGYLMYYTAQQPGISTRVLAGRHGFLSGRDCLDQIQRPRYTWLKRPSTQSKSDRKLGCLKGLFLLGLAESGRL